MRQTPGPSYRSPPPQPRYQAYGHEAYDDLLEAPRGQASGIRWGRAVTNGVFICSLVGIVADLLQPLAAFSVYALAGSLISCLVVGYLWYRFRREPRWSATLAPVTVALAITAATSAGLVIAQALIPEGRARGVLGASTDVVRDLQDRLSSIEGTVARVEQGVVRIEDSVGSIDRTTKSTDVRTKSMERGIEAIQKGSDPIANARRVLASSGYAATNEGYMTAVARGAYEAVSAYGDLGITGDEKSFRAALLQSPFGTREFEHLIFFMNYAHSQHYSKKVDAELKTFIGEMKVKKSLADLRTYSCNAVGHKSFVAEFARASLGNVCKQDGLWVEKAIKFIGHVLQDSNAYGWWTKADGEDILYQPSNWQSAAAIGDLIAAKEDRTPGYFRADLSFFLVRAVTYVGGTSTPTFMMYFPNRTSGKLETIYWTALSRDRLHAEMMRQPCYTNDRDRKASTPPVCSARFQVRSSGGHLRILAFENVRPVASAR
jgi:hypothetical protein